MNTETMELLVWDHLMEVDFTFIEGAKETQWEPADGDEITIKSFRFINVENEEWDESPDFYLTMPDLKKEIYLTLVEEIYQ